jgi:DNA-binding transcriptional LysR family regulator
MNDQILSLSGTATVSKSIRIGMPNVYASGMLSDLIDACRPVAGDERLQFCCESSNDLLRSLASGYLDLAFAVTIEATSARAVENWSEGMCWTCAPGLSTSPGSPIPLLSWPYGISDQIAIEAMEGAGLSYSIVFVASDLGAHLAALRSGIGYVALPERIVPSDLKIAREHFLPRLPVCKAGVYVNVERDSRKVRGVAECMANVLRPGEISPQCEAAKR